MDIGQKIKQAREQQGLSMNALAKRSGAAQSALSEIEKGRRQPTFEVLNRIVSGLGYTLSDFFSETKEEEPLSPEARRVIEKVKQLSPRQLKILEPVLDEWKTDTE